MQNNEALGRAVNLMYAAGDSIAVDDIAAYLDIPTEDMLTLLRGEAERRENDPSALLIKFFGDRVILATRPEYGEMIYDMLGKKSAEEITHAMMETLSIVAYRQPVTRPEIEELRGVNSAYILGVLAEKGLVAEAGRKEAVGRPMLYVTTEKFLKHFGITRIEDLPPLPEFKADEAAEDAEEEETPEN